MIKLLSLKKNILIFTICLIILSQTVFASKYSYPNISGTTTFSGGGTYCQNAVATLSFSYTSTSCNSGGGGGNIHTSLTVKWYSNTLPSTSGGTLVYSTTSSDGAGALTYIPSSASVGTTYYYIVISWSAQSCIAAGSLTSSATQTITINPMPAIYSLTGGGNYCSGGVGVTVGLSGSESGVTYQLQNNGTNIASPITGTGNAISFGNQTLAGSYSVIATNSSGCAQKMNGNATVSIDQASAGGVLPSALVYSTGNGTLTLQAYTGTILHWESSTDDSNWTTISNTSNSQSYSATTQAAYYRVWVQSGICSGAYSSISTVAVINHWNGQVNRQWNNSSNWSGKIVPANASPDIYIDSSGNTPELSQSISVTNFYVSSGASMIIDSTANLSIGGTISVSTPNSINASMGTITLNGSSAQTIPANMFANNALNNLVINNTSASGVSLGGTLDIYGSLTFTGSGKTLTTNDYLTLKSNASATARVGDMTNNNITGNITVERYIQSKKAWRFLSIPTNTNQTIQQAWQEGATSTSSNPAPGFGIQLSGPGGTAAGFDIYSVAPSIKTYNSSTGAWVGVPSTNTTNIKYAGGYMVFIRGDRTANSVSSPVTPVTLRSKGPIYTGTQSTINVPAGKFTAIGNPYASAIDIRNITKSGTKDFFYVWDPMLSGANGYGGYQTFSNNGNGNYVVTPGGGSYGGAGSINNYIQSGQAFFVQGGISDGTISFSESCKTSGSNVVNTPAGLPLPELRTTLIGINNDNSTYIADGVLVNYNDSYSNAVDDQDAIKSSNGSENLSIKRANNLLVVERRQPITKSDTIFLNISGLSIHKYEFGIFADQLYKPGMNGLLVDNYLNTVIPINIDGTTDITFSATSDAASRAANRFMIVFSPANTLPLTFTSIQALLYSNAVDVQWQVAQEMNVDHYETEKSADGITFNKIASTNASANNGNSATYVITDHHLVPGYNYYRVKSIDIDGKFEYSTVVKVNVVSTGDDITVFPNPALNGRINIEIDNQLAGKFIARLFTKTGQLIMQKDFEKPTAPLTQALQVDAGIPHGIYNLIIAKPDGTTKIIKIEF